MTQRGFISVIVIAMVILLFVAYTSADYRSCERTATTRAGLQQYFQSAADRSQKRSLIDVGLKRELDQQSIVADQRVVNAESASGCSVLP